MYNRTKTNALIWHITSFTIFFVVSVAMHVHHTSVNKFSKLAFSEEISVPEFSAMLNLSSCFWDPASVSAPYVTQAASLVLMLKTADAELTIVRQLQMANSSRLQQSGALTRLAYFLVSVQPKPVKSAVKLRLMRNIRITTTPNVVKK